MSQHSPSGDLTALAVRRMVEVDRLTASVATDRTPFSPFRIRPNMTYRSATVCHNAEVERDMLTAYERKLLTSYLANIASGLKRRDPEVRELIDWIGDRDNRIALGTKRRHRRRHLRSDLEKEKISTKKLRCVEESLRKECSDIPARRDRTAPAPPAAREDGRTQSNRCRHPRTAAALRDPRSFRSP